MSETAFDIASSGMAAHRAEMDVIAQNIANAATIRADGSGPYRARHVVFEPTAGNAFAAAMTDVASAFGMMDSPSAFGTMDAASSTFAIEPVDGAGLDAQDAVGVRVAGIVESDASPQYTYDPGNPLAIAAGPRKGFAATPDVDPIEQMVSLVSTGRAYDADVAALQAAKQMDVEAVDVDRS